MQKTPFQTHRAFKASALALAFASGSLLVSTASAVPTNTATVSAAGKVYIPITVTGTNMEVGSFAVNAGVAGTLKLKTDDSRVATGGVNASVTDASRTPAAANFSVAGEPNATYSVDITGGTKLLLGGLAGNASDATKSMETKKLYKIGSGGETALGLGADLTGGSGTLSAGGTQTILVGAELTVDAAQTPGVYSVADLTVTVNYN